MADDAIGKAVGAVPDGPLKKFLFQFGLGGIVLGVLLGNVPIAILIKALLSGKAAVDGDTLEIYLNVFVLVAPWVAVAGVLIYFAETDTWPSAVPGLAFAFGILVALSISASVSLGGEVPPPLVDQSVGSGPWGAFLNAANAMAGYLVYYGPAPVLAGAIEGGLLGHWASQLSGSRT